MYSNDFSFQVAITIFTTYSIIEYGTFLISNEIICSQYLHSSASLNRAATSSVSKSTSMTSFSCYMLYRICLMCFKVFKKKFYLLFSRVTVNCWINWWPLLMCPHPKSHRHNHTFCSVDGSLSNTMEAFCCKQHYGSILLLPGLLPRAMLLKYLT